MSEFSRIANLLDEKRQTEVTQKVREKFGSDAVKKITTQWSQLVAWSWREPQDYEPENQPSAEQETLRKNFIAAVKKLARYCLAEHYCPDMFKDQILALSDELSDYLNQKQQQSGVQLADIYKQLTNKNDYVFNQELTQSFVWVITVDRVEGWLAGYNQEQDQFVMVLPYPPGSTVTPVVVKPELNTIHSLLNAYEQTELEKKVMESLGPEATDKAQQFATQWSQLVAWSWLEPDDYEAGKKPSLEQENLRKAFIATVKELASYCIANDHYPGMFVEQIFAKSEVLSQYLNGKIPESGLTLPQLYNQLTNKKDYAFEEAFTQNFIWMVTVEQFNGWFAGYDQEKNKFLMVLAYPPRPALSPSVLQVSELREWSQGKGDGEYIPPNPYIPTCLC